MDSGLRFKNGIFSLPLLGSPQDMWLKKQQ